MIRLPWSCSDGVSPMYSTMDSTIGALKGPPTCFPLCLLMSAVSLHTVSQQQPQRTCFSFKWPHSGQMSMLFLTWISFWGFLLLYQLTSKLRLFWGAAIQKILSKRLEISSLPLVLFAGSINIAETWIAKAGPHGGLGRPGLVSRNFRCSSSHQFWRNPGRLSC